MIASGFCHNCSPSQGRCRVRLLYDYLLAVVDVDASLSGLAVEATTAEVEPAFVCNLDGWSHFCACYLVIVLTLLQEEDVVHVESIAFDIDFYFKMLRMKGYEVTPRYDKSKKLVGYTIGKNASVFKASEIGRRYMASQLEATWKKLHPKPVQVRVKPASPTVTPSSSPIRSAIQTKASTQSRIAPIIQPKPEPSFTTFNIDTPIGTKVIEISNSVKDIFLKEAQVPEGYDIATIEKVQLDEVNVAHTAMLLFAGYIDAATSMSESCGGGGGSTPESGWDKKDDEDERAYARRCLQMAHSMYKPKSVKRGFHR